MENSVHEDASRTCQSPQTALSSTDDKTMRTQDMTPTEECNPLGNALAAVSLMDFNDFIAESKKDTSQPEWIITDFIAKGMKGDICGASKSHKSFLAVYLAYCVATGTDLLDILRIPHRKRVCYLNLEIPDWNLRERLERFPTQPEDGYFTVINLRDKPTDWLTDENHQEELIKELLAKKIDLFIVDPRYMLLKDNDSENEVEGMRHILEIRNRFIKRGISVIFVTHDPKGETASKNICDRGAGSYTAGADFDFRITIDKLPDDNTFRICTESRVRKPPRPIGARFDEETYLFSKDDSILINTNIAARNRVRNQRARASSKRVSHDKFMQEAIKLIKSDSNLLSVSEFKVQMDANPNASVSDRDRDTFLRELIDSGVLATTQERDPKTKTGIKQRGKTFVSTPERINAYLDQFDEPIQ